MTPDDIAVVVARAEQWGAKQVATADDAGRTGEPQMTRTCPCCTDQWVEVRDPEHGRYWRRCMCWHEQRYTERVSFGVSSELAVRLQDSDIRSYLP